MIATVKDTIERHRLLRREGRVIVAVSGGADSVALLAALCELGYDCVAAHCNFHLRGAESTRDMRHVEELTHRLGVDLYVKDFDVAARQRATGESVEMACRELRYRWFDELLDREYAQCIAVGHHREDQAETFFLNLIRGSGVAGLAGMRYRNEHVVRPLLDVSRADIEAYLKGRGLEWVNDSTNAECNYARNRVRNRLLPLLEELFPGGTDGVLRSMAILRENAGFYTEAIRAAAMRYADGDGGMDLAELSGEPFAGAILYEYLRGEGFSRRQTDDMLAAAARQGGTFAASEEHVREVDHGMLRAPREARRSGADAVEVNLRRDIFEPLRIEVSRHNVAEFAPKRDPHTIYIDVRALEGNARWELRRWRRGDRMRPYGMGGDKLLSDIMADARLSAESKRQLWLLTRDGEIVWAVGLRASGLYTVGPGTVEYLQLRML
ncbi:MAG: tRNA lysidine(34) synthetase TilS [Muribaculaceae bacterium]|nr:tRNA lysidine(34) synthetase TilS [Muribaculaceae bacterium]